MPRTTIHDLIERKRKGHKITALTAYDALFSRIVDRAGIDIILVGDSLGMVVQGRDNTLSVTMDEMVYHTRMAARGAQNALIVGDMPFLSYQDVPEAMRNAGRFLQEGGACAVKVEGGRWVLDQVRAMVRHGIPVMGHIGMTPQSVHLFGGYRLQGNTPEDAARLKEEARALEQAGVFALVLEAIPGDLAREITASLRIPTIGIGAGPHCDGQILVLYDLLGLFVEFTPKFVRRYADLYAQVLQACQQYKEDVVAGKFPGPHETYHGTDR